MNGQVEGNALLGSITAREQRVNQTGSHSARHPVKKSVSTGVNESTRQPVTQPNIQLKLGQSWSK